MHEKQNNVREWKVGSKTISDASDCYVIAEIGHNHQGELAKARELFEAAKMAGVDAVKLQKRDNRSLFTKAFYNKPYENENSYGKTYGEHRDFLEFGKDEYRELQKLAADLEIDFFATAFDRPSADFLEELDIPFYKIASADLNNIPLMKHVASFKKPMIISTGGAGLDDVRRAHDAIMPINPQLCILQCTATYPTQPEDMHLNVIQTLRDAFPECVVGLSDHYNGIAMAVVAYMLGARVIEKHFTLNHAWKGTDHALSLEPIGMHKMVRDLHRTRVALGSPEKVCYDKEAPAIHKMSKSLYTKTALPKGHTLTEEDIVIKSPGGGMPPYRLEDVVGKTLQTDLDEEAGLADEHLG
jgi:sialic acid synthase